jgi:hypothetical protein
LSLQLADGFGSWSLYVREDLLRESSGHFTSVRYPVIVAYNRLVLDASATIGTSCLVEPEDRGLFVVGMFSEALQEKAGNVMMTLGFGGHESDRLALAPVKQP